MKKYSIISISLLSVALLSVSCDETFDSKYNDEWSEEDVWGNAITAQAVLNDVYTGIARRPDSYDSNFLDAATDNAMSSSRGTITTNLATGNYSSNNNPLDNWTACYSRIQDACLFLENCDNDELIYVTDNEAQNKAMKNRLKGEAYFLKAFYFFDLLQVYGGKSNSGEALGYPITNKFISTSEAEAMMGSYKRNTYAECIDHILADLDEAIFYLTQSGVSGVSEIGRATADSARALKSRVALYGASPAYQNDNVVKITGMGSFAVVDEAAYNASWCEAAGITFRMLVDTKSDSINKLASTDLADVTSSTPAEFLFRFYFNNRSMETAHFLPRYFGTAFTTPSQNLVDAYPTKDGYPITDPRSSYDPKNPYADRDDRFSLSIYYHGADYGLESFATAAQPLTKVDIRPDGADSPTKSHYASRTGYYLAKFMSRRFDMNNPTGTSNSAHYWAELRRSEMALSYAEAANEAWGPYGYGTYLDEDLIEQKITKSAYDVIKELRETSGGINNTAYLDEMAENKATFRQLIQNERRLELAFENHRFFDLRRCLLPLNETVRGVELSYKEDGNISYDIVDVEERKFDGLRHYYLPLPLDETTKGLENNMGW